MKSIIITIATFGALTSSAGTQEPNEKPQSRRPAVVPTLTDVKYGPDDRNVMDVWLASSDTPAPVLVSIHGGAFRHGDKSVSNAVLRECIAARISVAAITYRFSTHTRFGVTRWLPRRPTQLEPEAIRPHCVLAEQARLRKSDPAPLCGEVEQ